MNSQQTSRLSLQSAGLLGMHYYIQLQFLNILMHEVTTGIYTCVKVCPFAWAVVLASYEIHRSHPTSNL